MGPRQRHLSSTIVILIAAILAIAARWCGLAKQSLWWDEGYSLWVSQFSPEDIWRGVQTDTSPPLYYMLLHFWTGLFGVSEISLRSMSAFFETISLPFFYLIANRVLNSKQAILSAMWLYALSPFQVEYAKEARFYGVLVFCSVACLYSLLVFLQDRSIVSFSCLTLALAAGLYTHNMMFFYLPGVCMFWLIYPSSQSARRRVVDLLVCGTLVLLIYLPWFPALLTQTKAVANHFWVKKPNFLTLGQSLCTLSGLDPFLLSRVSIRLLNVSLVRNEKGFIAVGLLLFALSVFAGFWKVVPEGRRKLLAFLYYSLVPILLVFLYSQGSTSIFLTRVFISSATMLSIVFTISTAYQTGVRKTLSFGLVGGLLLGTAVCLAGYFKYSQKENWRAMTVYVSNIPQTRRVIVFAPPDGQVLFDYYLAKIGNGLARPPEIGLPEKFRFENPVLRSIRSYPYADLLIPLQEAVMSTKFQEIDLIQSHAPELLSEPLQKYLAEQCSTLTETKFDSISVSRCVLPKD